MSTTNILDLNNRIDALEKKQDQDTTDYEQLSHLPKINTVELKGNKTTSDLLISYNDITDKPTIPTSASGITYDNTASGLTATDVQGAVDELRQADNIMLSDGVTSVEDAISDVDTYSLTITGFETPITLQRVGRVVYITYNGNVTNLPAGSLSFSQVIPEKYRPAESTQFFSISAASDFFIPAVMLRFNRQGVIDGYNYRGAISSTTSCRFGTMSYIANS